MTVAVVVNLFGRDIDLRWGHLVLLAVVAFILLFLSYYLAAIAPKRGTLEWIDRAVNKPRLNYRFKLFPVERRDFVPLAIIIIIFTAVNFFALGDTVAPTTFLRFAVKGQSTIIELPAAVNVGKIMFYNGMYATGMDGAHYTLEYSQNGENWTELPSLTPEKHPTAMEQSHANVFKWRYADMSGTILARYLRVTSATGGWQELGEFAVFSIDGNLIPAKGAKELFDEQDLVPDSPSYMNGMYFDEIYHGRTAFETIRGLKLYETVHPPLGKSLITVGISLFGMTPFGWRCVGAAFGVAMLAMMYVLLKNMFGRTNVAVCGTLLFGFEFMRFTQTRISTVDTYGVFFILLAFLFMYRYIALPHGTSFRDTLRPLAMSGLFFGLGAASKWIVIYAGFGLLIMYVLKFFADYKYYYEDEGTPGLYLRRVVKILAFTALFFVVVPVIIYILAYIPFGTAKGMTVRGGMLWDPEYYKTVWSVNANMLKYHAGLDATHPYSSTWYQWLVDAKPILYYYDTSMGGGLKSAFSAFTNPLTTWAGLVAIGAMIYRVIRYRDNRALIILLGYCAQIVPWILITRCVFAYHYFPSVVFLIIAIAHMFDTAFERGFGRPKRWVYGFTAACGALFVMFYPVLSGLTVSSAYTRNVLQWFDSWVF